MELTDTIAEEAPLQASGEADWDNATKWHYEPDTFRPIAKETANGELFYIVNDHLGTPREMFSEDGKLVWAAQYRTWGAVHKIWQADNDNNIRGPYPPPIRGNLAFKYDTVEAQAAQSCPIRFQGQWEDAETGLYYNRYRYYDPLAAQYLSPDPIGLVGGLRSNGYVHNPSAWVDPWGLAKTDCCIKYLKSLPQKLQDNLNDTLSHINNGTKPTGPTKVKWGEEFGNSEGYLPKFDNSGAKITYKEYRVAPLSEGPDNNIYRVVTGSDGSKYFTGSHYGQIENNTPFMRLK